MENVYAVPCVSRNIDSLHVMGYDWFILQENIYIFGRTDPLEWMIHEPLFELGLWFYFEQLS